MLIDVHAHLDYYEEDLPAVLEEIEERHILTITSSVNPSAYRRNLEIAAASPLIVPTFGVHPLWAPEFADRIGFEVLSVEHVQEIARAVPEGQLLTETDNPAARSRMETQPMPSLVEDVIAGLAEVRGTTPEAIEALVERNLRELVGDDLWLDAAGIE